MYLNVGHLYARSECNAIDKWVNLRWDDVLNKQAQDDFEVLKKSSMHYLEARNELQWTLKAKWTLQQIYLPSYAGRKPDTKQLPNNWEIH